MHTTLLTVADDADTGLRLDTLQHNLDELEAELAQLQGELMLTEIGLTDLRASNYPIYCQAYEALYGCEPEIRRQAI